MSSFLVVAVVTALSFPISGFAPVVAGGAALAADSIDDDGFVEADKAENKTEIEENEAVEEAEESVTKDDDKKKRRRNKKDDDKSDDKSDDSPESVDSDANARQVGGDRDGF